MNKPKLIVFDVNHTIIEENSWLDLNLAMGMTKQEDEVLWGLNQEGLLTNIAWVEIVNNLYRERGQATRANIEKAILNYKYLPHAREVIKELQKMGYEIALISGAMDLVLNHLEKDLGVNHVAACGHFYFDDDDKFEYFEYLDDQAPAKAMLFRHLCAELNIETTDAVCVGDGDNDIELFELSGRGVTFEDSPIIEHAWKVIKDLSELPRLLA